MSDEDSKEDCTDIFDLDIVPQVKNQKSETIQNQEGNK